MRRLSPVFILAFAYLLILPALAFADSPQRSLALSPDQTWVALLGALVPLLTYVLNHYAPWVSEEVKGLIFFLASAAVGAVYKAIDSGLDFTKAATWEYIGTAVLAAIVAHNGLYKPAGWNLRLGAGQNVTPRKVRRTTR